MSDKPKLWNNPVVILGMMVAVILVSAAVMYLFYTRLAGCKVLLDESNKKINELKSDVASARTRVDVVERSSSKVVDIEARINTLEHKVKKLKTSTSSTSSRKPKCDGDSCEITDL